MPDGFIRNNVSCCQYVGLHCWDHAQHPSIGTFRIWSNSQWVDLFFIIDYHWVFLPRLIFSWSPSAWCQSACSSRTGLSRSHMLASICPVSDLVLRIIELLVTYSKPCSLEPTNMWVISYTMCDCLLRDKACKRSMIAQTVLVLTGPVCAEGMKPLSNSQRRAERLPQHACSCASTLFGRERRLSWLFSLQRTL